MDTAQAQAAIDRLMSGAFDEIAKLLSNGPLPPNKIIFVTNSSDKRIASTVPRTTTGELVMTMPIIVLASLLRTLGEVATVDSIIDQIQRPPPPERVFVLANSDGAFALLTIRLVAMPGPNGKITYGITPDQEGSPTVVRKGDDFLMNVRGILVMLYETDPANAKSEEARAKILRIRELGDAALAAETIRANPRPKEEVLYAAFKGETLNEVLGREGLDGMMRHLDKMLTAANAKRS